MQQAGTLILKYGSAGTGKPLLKEEQADILAFGDGSGYKGGVGAAVVMYRNGKEVEVLRDQLGAEEDHEVYKAECVRMILGLHAAKRMEGIDNMVAITATDTATTRPSHYLLDYFHGILRELRLVHPRIKVTISWVPGHMGYTGNKREADIEAKKAAVAASQNSPNQKHPQQLHKPLPRSCTSVVMTYRKDLECQHAEEWRGSP
ncbi:hypothetical protein BT96DRAFT_835541 [Gymnopus androsaceus JB14]|uniref:Uncharacterized protein n=1 Tax=Gymnopus androsaceus JB14 TaxID=1447944 RepID=A0A6A4GUF2_9AGAR|nr:hypothetical protein BT96DRAFT_835541 [Gymnopus androsaceus JB14]